jgi:nicotinamide phosphoribosyltransferase
MVFGIGSYTYQYVTRDTLGFAMKATYGEVAGEPKEIFKDPITDGGVKKSAKGLLSIEKDAQGKLVLLECVDSYDESRGELKTVFINGLVSKETSLNEIRTKIDQSL